MTRTLFIFQAIMFAAGLLCAQQQPPPFDRGPGPPQGPNRPPMERGFHAGPPGRWWMDPMLVQKLGLTADQQKRIDALFQQHRLKLIDLSAGVQKEEAMLEPLLEADRPEESQVLAQIDRIAQARAELEKANARMLLGFRGVLTLDQWKKLQAERPPRHGEHP
jgi:periplasmic protein CpxP/Spy